MHSEVDETSRSTHQEKLKHPEAHVFHSRLNHGVEHQKPHRGGRAAVIGDGCPWLFGNMWILLNVATIATGTTSSPRVMRVFHVSGNGGTTLCEMARNHPRVAVPHPAHNCNPIGAGPIWNSYHLRPPQGQGWRKCGWNPADERANSSKPRAGGVFFIEAGLDVEFPCAKTVDVLLVREPWSRARSRIYDNIANLERCSKDRGLNFPLIRQRWAEAYARSEPSRRNGSAVTVDEQWGTGILRKCVRAVDNVLIRWLLGSERSFAIAPGEVTMQHMEEAKRLVNKIDYFFFTSKIASAHTIIPQIFPVAGEWSALSGEGEHRHVYPLDDKDLPITEEWFRKTNVPDLELYNHILEVAQERDRVLTERLTTTSTP